MIENTTILTLQNCPHRIHEVIQLIESSFSYPMDQSFMTDFYPLMSEQNLNNLFIIIDQKTDTIIAHTGVLVRELTFTPHKFKANVLLIGGVCTHPSYQKKGLSTQLLNHIHKKFQSNVLFFILWSNLNQFYERFGYIQLGINQQTGSKKINQKKLPLSYKKSTYHQLSSTKKEEIQNLYNDLGKSFFVFQRQEQDWNNIEKMISSELYIREKNQKIVSYFFYQKGQDLKEIIHELAPHQHSDIKSLLEYKLWTPLHDQNHNTDSQNQIISFYTALFKIGNKEIFQQFLYTFFNSNFKILSLDDQFEEIIFSYNGQSHTLAINQFLPGILGPHYIKEFISFFPPFYLSGLDSI